jgi:NAD(P)H-hydrate epimerase
MAALESQLFASGLPVEALMEKAALAIARQLLARPPAAALVLVGPGHNGGDGLVVARELHLAGVPVRLWTPFERAKPLTSAHLRHCRWLGIPLLEAEPDPNDGALWIDGLFGIGQQRPIEDSLARLLTRRHQGRPGALVAIDVPTGLCSDSGRLVGDGAARARTTYCLGLLKQGLVQDTALAWVGQLERIDLGLPASQLVPLVASQPLALGAADGATAPWPELDPAAGKYGRGRLLVLAGSPRYPGAAELCLQGASASGCGSLKALVPEAGAPGLWASQPHVVLLDPAALESPRTLERFDAVVFGPGLGPPNQQRADPSQQHLQQQLWDQLQGFAGLLLLDADGLNRLADLNQTQGTGASQWLRQRQGPTWLTPHGAEFERLFPDLAGLPPLEAAAAAAQGAAATVLLKGAHSVIAAADGRRWQLIETCPDAARAGLGDVLAGYAAGRGAMAVASGRAFAAGRAFGAEGAAAPSLIPLTSAEERSAAKGLDGALLAAAALSHGQAGWLARRRGGPGGATPMAVAAALATQSFNQSAEICSQSDAAMGRTNPLSTDGSQY